MANGAVRVLSLSIVNNKTEQQHRMPGIGRKGNPRIPCNPVLHSAGIARVLTEFISGLERKEGGWGGRKKKKDPCTEMNLCLSLSWECKCV